MMATHSRGVADTHASPLSPRGIWRRAVFAAAALASVSVRGAAATATTADDARVSASRGDETTPTIRRARVRRLGRAAARASGSSSRRRAGEGRIGGVRARRCARLARGGGFGRLAGLDEAADDREAEAVERVPDGRPCDITMAPT